MTRNRLEKESSEEKNSLREIFAKPQPSGGRLFLFLWFCLGGFGFEHVAAEDTIPVTDLTDYFTVRHHDELSGFPDGTVNDLLLDDRGVLWIATTDGLCLYDGAEFEVLRRSNEGGLPENHIVDLQKSQNGRIWVATQSSGVIPIEKGILAPPRELADLAGVELQCLYQRENDPVLWIGTRDGLFSYDPRLTAPLGRYLTGFSVYEVVSDANFAILVASNQGLWKLEPDEASFLKVPDPQGVKHLKSATWVGRLTDGRIIGAFLNPERQSLEQRELYSLVGNDWARYRMGSQSQVDHQGSMVIQLGGKERFLQLRNGCEFVLGEGKSLKHFKSPPFLGEEVSNIALEDHEGNIWVGMNKLGLVQLVPRPASVVSGFTKSYRDNVWAVCEKVDGTVIIGADGGVFSWVDGETQQIGNPEGLGESSVRALVVDQDEIIWAGTGHGLFALRKSRWEPYPLLPQVKDLKVRALYADSTQHGIWVGHSGGASFIHDGLMEKHLSASSGLPSNDVRAFHRDHLERLWIATFGGGLTRIENGKIKVFTDEEGLGSNYVWGLEETPPGRMWATSEKGLSTVIGSRIFNFTTDHGLPMNTVNDVIADDSGRLWITSDRGCYVGDIDAFEAVAAGTRRSIDGFLLTEADGFLHAEANGQKSQPALWRDRSGQILVPTIHGLAIVDSSRLDHIRPPKSVYLTSVREGNQEIDFIGTGDNRVEFSTRPGGGQFLTIKFRASTFNRPDRLDYFYRPISSPDWIPLGKQAEILLTELAPGKYSFEFQVEDVHRLRPEHPLLVTFDVPPTFMQSWPFRILGAVASLFAVWGFWRARQNTQRRTFELEAFRQVQRERERIAEDLHDDFGSEVTKLVLSLDAAERHAKPSKDLEKTLKYAKEVSQRIGWKVRQAIWALDPEPTTVVSLVEQTRAELSQLLLERNIQLHFDQDIPIQSESLMMKADLRYDLLCMLKELATNSVKHSQATKLELWFKISGDCLTVSLADNGSGFEPSRITRGHGLRNIQKRAIRIGASFEMDTGITQPTGTRATIVLPLTGSLARKASSRP